MFTNEKIIETKLCKLCSSSFDITGKDIEFYEKVSPIFGGKKYLIPSPTLCPDCRQQRRMSFRNERKLYKRKCDGTGVDIVSLYSPDKLLTVYSQKYWWSDNWDALSYGMEFDFGKSFFEQFTTLQQRVPKIAIMNDDGLGTSENSAYCQDFAFGKNCYFVISSWFIEDCLYSDCVLESKDIVDSIMISSSSDVYEGIDCKNIQNCTYVQFCNDSHHCNYSYDLVGCSYCFGCIGLKNKSYYILNEAYSKDEYEKKMKEIIKDMRGFFHKRNTLFSSFPRRALSIFSSENSVGNNIFNSSNVYYGFEVADSKNLRYCYRVNTNSNDSMDVHQTGLIHLVYEGLTPDKTYKGAFISWCWEGCKDIYYCDTCITCSYCFGCIGLRNKSYCILNKQYTKEEYEELVPRIIEHMMQTGEWGEFFPSTLSPFGYNETITQEYFPLTREEVLNPQSLRDSSFIKGANTSFLSSKEDTGKVGGFLHGPLFNWSDYEAPFPKVEKIIPASKLPNDISSIPDDILNWAIECEVTKKPFRIIKQELEFYRKHHLPIPHKHPDQRHLERMQLRNPRKLFTRHCYKCTKEIQTTYAPERPEIVYCEECYNREVY